MFDRTLFNVNAVGQPTDITLEVSSSLINVDDTVSFSGSLVNSKTGNGIEGKTITIYREGPIIPIPFETAVTGINGAFNANWIAKLERNTNTPITVFAQFDGDDDALIFWSCDPPSENFSSSLFTDTFSPKMYLP